MRTIDYEITVDVSKVSIGTKKLVQDTFFKLGFDWWFNGKDYTHLDAQLYTNTRDVDVITGYIYIAAICVSLHTIDQILELVK